MSIWQTYNDKLTNSDAIGTTVLTSSALGESLARPFRATWRLIPEPADQPYGFTKARRPGADSLPASWKRPDFKNRNERNHSIEMPAYTPQPNGTLPPHIKKLIETPPATGTGKREVHKHILKAANRLRHYVSADEAIAYLSGCPWPRPLKPNELEETIQKAYSEPKKRRRNRKVETPPKLAVDVSLIEQIVAGRIGPKSALTELRVSSPAIPGTTAEILQILFEPGSLICAAAEFNRSYTRELEQYVGLEDYQFIVPSPMSARYWTDTRGRRHARGNANVGPRRFIVTDFDIKPTRPGGAPSSYAVLIGKWIVAGVTIQDGMAALIGYLAEHGWRHSMAGW